MFPIRDDNPQILVPYAMDSVFQNKELYQVLKVNRDNHYQVVLRTQEMLGENTALMKEIDMVSANN